jgi:hypothetical protein
MSKMLLTSMFRRCYCSLIWEADADEDEEADVC